MRKVDFTANRRLLYVEHISHDPAAEAEAFTTVTAPATSTGNTPPERAPAAPALMPFSPSY